MDGARTNYDEEASGGVSVLDYGGGGITGVEDGRFGGGRLRNLVLKEVGRGERVVATNCGW